MCGRRTALLLVSLAVSVLVVIPTYDEAENIADVIGRVRASVPEAHVLVVDDNSPDGTADLAEAAGAELGQVEVLRRAEKGGLGPAYRAGFAWGLERGLRRPGGDGRRPLPRPGRPARTCWPRSRAAPTWPSAAATCPAARCRGGPGTGWPSPGRATPTRHLRAGHRPPRRHRRLPGLPAPTPSAASTSRPSPPTATASRWRWPTSLVRSGHRVVEVPITFRDRIRGTSKMSLSIVGEALRLVTWWGIRDRVLHRGRAAEAGTPPGGPA